MADNAVYVLPDGREFHVELRKRPALLIFPDEGVFCMGNNTGLVVGEPVIIPDPEKNPEMVEVAGTVCLRLKPESSWPPLTSDTAFIRGLAGVPADEEATERYEERRRILGIPTE